MTSDHQYDCSHLINTYHKEWKVSLILSTLVQNLGKNKRRKNFWIIKFLQGFCIVFSFWIYFFIIWIYFDKEFLKFYEIFTKWDKMAFIIDDKNDIGKYS